MKLIFIFIFAISIFSCQSGDNKEKVEDVDSNKMEEPKSADEAILMEKQKAMSTTGDKEFKENKKKIEKIYGEQWDFCHCVVVNDSLDKQAKAGKIGDKFMSRFEEVENHCKAFLVMDDATTPEERDIHDKKVQKCLRTKGIK